MLERPFVPRWRQKRIKEARETLKAAIPASQVSAAIRKALDEDIEAGKRWLGEGEGGT